MPSPSDEIRAYVAGRRGPAFGPLVTFAGPLLDAYGVETERVEALASGEPDPAEEELLLVLDTARLLWAYCALGPDDAHAHLPALERAILSGDADDEGRMAFHVLLAELEEGFHDLDPRDRAAALPPFADLLGAYAAAYPTDTDLDDVTVPADDEAEALARFARPLLDRPGLDADGEFERRMDLALALWTASKAADRPAALAAVQARFPDETDPERLLTDLLARAHA